MQWLLENSDYRGWSQDQLAECTDDISVRTIQRIERGSRRRVWKHPKHWPLLFEVNLSTFTSEDSAMNSLIDDQSNKHDNRKL